MISPAEVRSATRNYVPDDSGDISAALRLAEQGFDAAGVSFELAIAAGRPHPLVPGLALNTFTLNQLSALSSTVHMYSTYPGVARVHQMRLGRLLTTLDALQNDFRRLIETSPQLSR